MEVGCMPGILMGLLIILYVFLSKWESQFISDITDILM